LYISRSTGIDVDVDVDVDVIVDVVVDCCLLLAHEELDVYRCSIEFLALSARIGEAVPG